MSYIRFMKEDVSAQVQDIFKNLFNKVNDNALLSITAVNDNRSGIQFRPSFNPVVLPNNW